MSKLRVSKTTAADRVYNMCVKNRWCTCASIMSYNKVFDLVREERPIHDIALAIWVVTVPEVKFSDIYGQIESALMYKEEEE